MDKDSLIYPKVFTKKLQDIYSLRYSAAVSVFHLVEEMTRCVNLKELIKVQSVCFYNRPDNPAYDDLYRYISMSIGSFRPGEDKAVFKLRTAGKRGEPDGKTPTVVGIIIERWSDFLGIPPSAWYRSERRAGDAPRFEKFRYPVENWQGEYLAKTDNLEIADYLSKALRGFPEGIDESGHLYRHEFADYAVARVPCPRKVFMKDHRRGFEQIYTLARLAMCETDNQAAHVVGYYYVRFRHLFDAVVKVWPQIEEKGLSRVGMKVHAKLLPYGEPCGNRAARAAVAVAVELAAREGYPFDPLEWLMKAAQAVGYCGDVVARDRTKTRANTARAAEHYELFRVGKFVAIASSKQSALTIERAVSASCRHNTLKRVQAAIDAYRNADDLV